MQVALVFAFQLGMSRWQLELFRAYTEMVRVIPREEYIVSISYGVFRAYTGTPKKANAGRLS